MNSRQPHQQQLQHSLSTEKLAAAGADNRQATATVKLKAATAPAEDEREETCSLCNCGDKCLLGQGDLQRFEVSESTAGLLSGLKLVQRRLHQQQQSTNGGAGQRNDNEKLLADCLVGYLESLGSTAAADADDSFAHYLNKNANLANLFKSLAAQSTLVLNENIRRLQIPEIILDDLHKVGWNLESGLFKPSLLVEPASLRHRNRHICAHTNCLAWSTNAQRTPDESGFIHVDQLACESLTKKCFLCSRYGASIKCVEAGCDRVFHYPCAIISGCYQDSSNHQILCSQHLDRATRHFDQATMACCLCDTSDRLAEQLLCTSCGLHFHSDCLSSIDTNATWSSTANNMIVRMDWQCPECKLCQSCMKSGDDTKTLVCDTCDKCYHIFCLRPEFVSGSGGGQSGGNSTSPNNGWKCPRCKVCQRCDKRLIKTPAINPVPVATVQQTPPVQEQILALNLSTNLCGECYKLKCSLCSKESSLNDLSRRLIRSCSTCKNHYHVSCDPGSDLLAKAAKAGQNVAAVDAFTCTYCINSSGSSGTAVASAVTAKGSMNSISKHEHPQQQQQQHHHHLTSPILEKEGNRKRSVKDLLELAHSNNYCQQQPQTQPTAEITAVTVAVNLLKREAVDIKDELVDSSSNQSSSSSHSNQQTAASTKPPINSKKKQISKKTAATATNKNIKRQTSANGGQSSGSSSTSSSSSSSTSCRSRTTRNNSNNSSNGSGGGKDARTTQLAGGKGAGGKKESSASPRPGSASAELDEPTIGHIKRDEEDHHAVTVILSLDDSVTQRQDMCLNCGSFGQGDDADDAQTISCSQCGQCYHTYCAGINNVSEVMREKGWRCLDCTVCEGCGKATDESRLLLCDDCDISYHIYCLSPPLEHVPKGNWKCKWCVKCSVCGTKSSHPAAKNQTTTFEWKNNYTECALCNSLHTCHVCNTSYTEQDIVLKCLTCDRWSHSSCSVSTNSAHHHSTHHQLISEDEAERITKRGFHCSRCVQENTLSSSSTSSRSTTQPTVESSSAQPELSLKKQLENENLLPFIDKLNRLVGGGATNKRSTVSAQQLVDDGVYLTESGQELMKQLKIKPAPAHPIRRARTVKSATTGGQQPMDVDPAVSAAALGDEDASRSSNEDGTKKLAATVAAQQAAAAAKRHMSVGIGGFNPKARNRKQNENLTASNEGAASKQRPGRRKLACEEMMPQYIQEAFFGPAILNKCKEDGGAFSLEDRKFLPPSEYESFSDSLSDDDDDEENEELISNDDENNNAKKVAAGKHQRKEAAMAAHEGPELEAKLKRQRSRNQMLSRRNSTVNRYHFTNHVATGLDSDNTIKLSKHNKNDVNLELGIEDLLDGDIVNYLFSENRTLMEFSSTNDPAESSLSSSNQQQQPSGQRSSQSNAAPDQATAQHQQQQSSSSENTSKQQSLQQQNRSNSNNPFMDDSTSRNKLYDDLFSNINDITPTVGAHPHHDHHHHPGSSSQLDHNNRQTLMMGPSSAVGTGGSGSGSSSDYRNTIDDLARQFKESTHKYASQTSQTAAAASPGPIMNMQQQQQQHPGGMNPLNQHQHPQSAIPQQQHQVSVHPNMNRYNDVPSVGMNLIYMNQPPPPPQQQQQQMHQPHQQQHIQMAGQQQQQHQPSITVSLVNNDEQRMMTNAPAPAAVQQQASSVNPAQPEIKAAEKDPEASAADKAAEDALKQKKLVEKYLEDEELGELATQAMPLYTNLHHPNLKSEFPDATERYKQVMKLWRKLDDAALKTSLVNKSRQNRTLKRKTDNNEGDSASNHGATSSSNCSQPSSAATGGKSHKKSKVGNENTAAVELSNEIYGGGGTQSSLPSSRSQTPHSSLNINPPNTSSSGNTVASILESNDAANRLMLSQQHQQQQQLQMSHPGLQDPSMQQQQQQQASYVTHGGQQMIQLHPQQQQQQGPPQMMLPGAQQQQANNNNIYFYQVRPQQQQMNPVVGQPMLPNAANWQQQVQQGQQQAKGPVPQYQVPQHQQMQRPHNVAAGQYYMTNAQQMPQQQMAPNQQMGGYQLMPPNSQQLHQMNNQSGVQMMQAGGNVNWNTDPQKPQQQQQPMRVYIGPMPGQQQPTPAAMPPIEIQLSQSPRPAPQLAVVQENQQQQPATVSKPADNVHSFANRFPSAASSSTAPPPVQQAQTTSGKPASQNTATAAASAESKDVSDHIDSIIDAVACGSGTIPYGDTISNFADEEEAENADGDDDDFFPDSNDPKSRDGQSDTENTGMDDDDDDNGSNSLKQYNTLKFINEKASEFFSNANQHEQDALTLSTSSLTIPSNSAETTQQRKASPSSSMSSGFSSDSKSNEAGAAASAAAGKKTAKPRANKKAAAAVNQADGSGDHQLTGDSATGEKTVKKRKTKAQSSDGGQPPKPKAAKATKINQHPQMQQPQMIQMSSNLSETSSLIQQQQQQQQLQQQQQQAVYFNKPILLDNTGAMISSINPSMFINASGAASTSATVMVNSGGSNGPAGGSMVSSAANIVYCKDGDGQIKKMISINECNVYQPSASSQSGGAPNSSSTIIYQQQQMVSNNGVKSNNVLMRPDCFDLASTSDTVNMPTLTQIQMFTNNGAGNGNNSSNGGAGQMDKFFQLDGQLDNEDDDMPGQTPQTQPQVASIPVVHVPSVVKPSSFVVIQNVVATNNHHGVGDASNAVEVKAAPTTVGALTNGAFTVHDGGVQHPQLTTAQILAPPSFNGGDNTLLKALLQTAPKNASSGGFTPSTTAAVIVNLQPQQPATVIVDKAPTPPTTTVPSNPEAVTVTEIKVEKSDNSNLSDAIEAAISKAASQTSDSKDSIGQQAQPAGSEAPPPPPVKQRKKAAVSTNRKKATIAATISTAMSAPSPMSSASSSLLVSPAAGPAPTILSDQEAAFKIFEYLKSTLSNVNSNSSSHQQLKMSQPKQPIIGNIRQHHFINYPGRLHSVLMGKSIGRVNEDKGFFQLEIEPLKPGAAAAQSAANSKLLSMNDNKKFVDFIINDPHKSSSKPPAVDVSTKPTTAAPDGNKQSSSPAAQLVNYFKVLNGNSVPIESNLSANNGLNDSKERLNDLLSLDEESISQIEAALNGKHESADALASSINDAISNAMAASVSADKSATSSTLSSSSSSKSKKIINLINNLDKMKATGTAAPSAATTTEDDSQSSISSSQTSKKSASVKPAAATTVKVNGHEHEEKKRGDEYIVINEYLKKKLKPLPRSNSSQQSFVETMDTTEVVVVSDAVNSDDVENAGAGEPTIKYEAPSPVIGLCSYGQDEPMDTSENTAVVAVDKPAVPTVKMSIKLDRSAAASVKSTLKQLTNILSVDFPSAFELGRLVKQEDIKSDLDKYTSLKRYCEQQSELAKRQQLQQVHHSQLQPTKADQDVAAKRQADEQKTAFISRLLKLSSENSRPTGSEAASSSVLLPSLVSQTSVVAESNVTLQAIISKYEKTTFKFCKFCEAFLNDFIGSGVIDCSALVGLVAACNEAAASLNKENNSSAAAPAAAATLKPSTAATTTSQQDGAAAANELLKFCCSPCQFAFQKLVTLRRIITASAASKQEQAANALKASSSLNSSREDLTVGPDETALTTTTTSTTTAPLTSASLINSCLEATIYNVSPLANINPAASTSTTTTTTTTTVSKKASSSKRKATSEIKWFKWNANLMATVTTHANTIQQAIASASSAVAMATTTPKFETLKPAGLVDKRVCCFCHQVGDLGANGPSRLLTMDMGRWCHLNCALWSDEVYETMNGALINVDVAFKKSLAIECSCCKQKGASLKCFFQKCANNYHLHCAIKDKCSFTQDKTIYCPAHSFKAMSNVELLTDLSVFRNVWIQRDEVAQIQSFVSRDIDEDFFAIRIGSLILHSIGQLLPHQLSSSNFHNRNFVYPVGYRATRFYWSVNQCYKRCRYVCSIGEATDGLPEFTVSVLEDGVEKETLTDKTPTLVWNQLLDRLDALRKTNDLVKIFPSYCSGEYLFGLAEPHVTRLIESLPGVETLTNYAFKYGRLQLLDMPLTINPTGCARSEPKLRTHFRSSHKITIANSSASTSTAAGGASSSSSSAAAGSSSSASATTSSTGSNQTGYYEADDYEMDEYGNTNAEEDYYTKSDDNVSVSYNKQFTLSKSTQYKKLKAEWRSNVFLAKSQIQGLGLYAARDLEKNTMIIEYIGDMIRNEVANTREKLYQLQNRGVYMFRLNDDFVIDATITGGLARYVNHCCDPNCVAETVSLEKEQQKIIIIANKRILKGEELTYDYKFDFEDESNKISCLCGSANCKKWMN